MARRVQRVTEEYQSRDALLACRRNLGSNASPHRLAADHQLSVTGVIVKFSAADGLNDGAIAAFQLIVPIGQPPALLRIDKVECYGVDTARGERSGKADHKAAGLVGAGAVRKDQNRACVAAGRCAI